MEEEKNHKVIPVGLDMLALIETVKSKFKEEYGFQPTIIDVTNLIAKRVSASKLF